jgi:hypothetical protein
VYAFTEKFRIESSVLENTGGDTMKASMLKYAFGLVTISIALAIAQPAWADQWTPAVTPVTAQAGNYNNTLETYISTTQAVVNPANCPALDGYVVSDPIIADQSLAIALSALIAGRSIKLYLSSTQCADSRPKVLSIQLL